MPLLDKTLRALVVDETADRPEVELRELPIASLPEGELLLRGLYSSLNYKDALAVRGHPGIVRQFPHVPGIDVVGEVLSDSSRKFTPGETVFITGHDLGVGRWGGYSSVIRAPVAWAQRLPGGLTALESMTFGTAGFTAALCVQALLDQGLHPDAGDVLVTGASGGVGSLAVSFLAAEGFSVVVSTSKQDVHDMLLALGAARIASREDIADASNKPLVSAVWAGAVDTVGGAPLASLLRAIKPRGAVAACGNAAGVELPTTVLPFILRGVKLIGIDSVWQPMDVRHRLWALMANRWKPTNLAELATCVSLADVPNAAEEMLAGESRGRVVVDLS